MVVFFYYFCFVYLIQCVYTVAFVCVFSMNIQVYTGRYGEHNWCGSLMIVFGKLVYWADFH